MADVSEAFYKVKIRSFDKDPSKGSLNFINYINGYYKRKEASKYYDECLKGLQDSYTCEILVNILAYGH